MSERIPPPTDNAAQWRHDMAILDADPRTSGNANRPPWLVRRVLDDAKERITLVPTPKLEVAPRSRIERVGRASGIAERVAADTAAICLLVESALPATHNTVRVAAELRVLALRMDALLAETLKRCP